MNESDLNTSNSGGMSSIQKTKQVLSASTPVNIGLVIVAFGFFVALVPFAYHVGVTNERIDRRLAAEEEATKDVSERVDGHDTAIIDIKQLLEKADRRIEWIERQGQ